MRAKGDAVSRILAVFAVAATLAAPVIAQQPPTQMNASMQKLESELVAKYGEAQRARLQRGMKQVAQFWRAEDGDEAAFEDLVRTHFAPSTSLRAGGEPQTLDALFNRMQ